MGVKAAKKLSYFFWLICVTAFSSITALGSMTNNIDQEFDDIICIIGICLPALVLICFILSITMIFKKSFFFFIPIIGIAANYENINAQINYFADDAKGEKKEIKIATCNVHSFNYEITGHTVKRMAEAMDSAEVDVICLQEFKYNSTFNLDSIKNAFSKYPYSFIPTNKGKTRLAYFSRLPIKKKAFIKFKDTDNCAAFADVSTSKEKTYRIFNVHMQTTTFSSTVSKQMANNASDKDASKTIFNNLIKNSRIRAKQAKMIRRLVMKSPNPCILCGDFNDTPSSYTYHNLLANMKDGFKEAGNGYTYTYNAFGNLLRIDYIFHNPALKCTFYATSPQVWSDHNPVIASYSLR